MIKMGMKTLDWRNFDPKDNLMNIKDKYSFVSAPVSENKLCLLHAFMANEDTRSFFTKGKNGNVVVWKRNKCVEWMKRYKKLLEILAVLCHLLGGQPACGSEFTTLRWRNAFDEQRDMYWVNHTIMLLATYSKTRSITRKDKLIPR